VNLLGRVLSLIRTYSIMDSETNKILHFENVDKHEVGMRYPNMEREGMT